MNPLVSVILPTRNRAEFLQLAIKSVLSQTEVRLELIIVDDASSDSTQNVIAHYIKQDERVRCIRNVQPEGGGGARNLGVRNAKCRWIAFIDDDDVWLPEKMARQIELLSLNPTSVAASCFFQQQFPSGKSKIIQLKDRPSFDDLLCGNILGGASMCICVRETLVQIGGFDTALLSGQDWDLWIRLRERGDIVVCPEVLVIYQAHENQRISNNMNAQNQGARRFHFKYRARMTPSIRKLRIAYATFIMSRQTVRSKLARLRYLLIATKYAGSAKKSFSYVASSFPRLLADWYFSILKI